MVRTSSLISRMFLATTVALLAGSFCLPEVLGKSSRVNGEVRVSREDGLITMNFHTPSGGKVSAFLPLNVQPGEAQIGGTVERELPTQSANSSQEALNEIAGVVTIEPKRKDKVPPAVCPPNGSSFTCSPPDDGVYEVTYKPPHGPSCTQTVQCQPETPSNSSADSCGIPQLTANNGNLHVSMQPPANGDPSNNSGTIGGAPATCRAWSHEGCVFHVPQASKVPPGTSSVSVTRDNRTARGETHVAEVKMSCNPSHLRPGEPCTVTTTVYCPGMNNVKDGKLLIKNYNPAVLDMLDKVIPIPYTGKQ